MSREQTEQRICAAICQSNGLKAKDIARQLNLDRSTVNRVLYASPLLKDLCYQDDSYRWHGIIRQSVPHDGLYEFSGYYAKASDFLRLTEAAKGSGAISTIRAVCSIPSAIAGDR